MERYSKETKNKYDREHILRTVMTSPRFRIGLSKLGQKTLLDAFNEYFPEEAAPPAMTTEELRESFRSAMDVGRKKNAAKKN